MMKRILICIVCLLSLHYCPAQKTDRTLQKQINELLIDFHGEVGVYIKDLKTRKTIAINADSVFPTASIVKVPILIGIMDKINKGELS